MSPMEFSFCRNADPGLLVCARGAGETGGTGHRRHDVRRRGNYSLRSVVGGCDSHELVDLFGPAEESHIVARHHSTLAVSHQVHLLRPRRSQHRINERGELPGGVGYGCRGVHSVGFAVVKGEDAVPRVLEVRRHGDPVLRHVLEGPGNQDHRIGVGRRRLAGPVIGSGRRDIDGVGLGGQRTEAAGKERDGGY